MQQHKNLRKPMQNDTSIKQYIERDVEDPYCEKCGTCGFVECCGVYDFLKEHVIGKTKCKNEHSIVLEILDAVNQLVHETMQVDPERIDKIYKKLYKAQQTKQEDK